MNSRRQSFQEAEAHGSGTQEQLLTQREVSGFPVKKPPWARRSLASSCLKAKVGNSTAIAKTEGPHHDGNIDLQRPVRLAVVRNCPAVLRWASRLGSEGSHKLCAPPESSPADEGFIFPSLIMK